MLFQGSVHLSAYLSTCQRTCPPVGLSAYLSTCPPTCPFVSSSSCTTARFRSLSQSWSATIASSVVRPVSSIACRPRQRQKWSASSSNTRTAHRRAKTNAERKPTNANVARSEEHPGPPGRREAPSRPTPQLPLDDGQGSESNEPVWFCCAAPRPRHSCLSTSVRAAAALVSAETGHRRWEGTGLLAPSHRLSSSQTYFWGCCALPSTVWRPTRTPLHPARFT